MIKIFFQYISLLFLPNIFCVPVIVTVYNYYQNTKIDTPVNTIINANASFTYTYKGKTYGPFICKDVGTSVKINPLNPSIYTTSKTTPLIDTFGCVLLTSTSLFASFVYLLYRFIFSIDSGNWFIN